MRTSRHASFAKFGGPCLATRPPPRGSASAGELLQEAGRGRFYGLEAPPGAEPEGPANQVQHMAYVRSGLCFAEIPKAEANTLFTAAIAKGNIKKKLLKQVDLEKAAVLRGRGSSPKTPWLRAPPLAGGDRERHEKIGCNFIPSGGAGLVGGRWGTF